MYPEYNNYQNFPYFGQQPYSQQSQLFQQNRGDVSQFVTVLNENEIGSRLMPRDGTPVFYRVKDTQDVFECAFINGQTCITAYSLVPKIQKQTQQQNQQPQQNNSNASNSSSYDELNKRLSHVEKYLQELTAGGNNNASVYPSNTGTETVRSVTPSIS
jgi:hypothetical protein